jgi:hypothetical protein
MKRVNKIILICLCDQAGLDAKRALDKAGLIYETVTLDGEASDPDAIPAVAIYYKDGTEDRYPGLHLGCFAFCRDVAPTIKKQQTEPVV